MDNELATLTGQKIETIQHDLKRDFYLVADEAVQYGLIDRVLLPNVRKRATRGQEADLGTFEGEVQQRYQNQPNTANDGGWGSRSGAGQQQQSTKKDDDEPKIMKG